MNFLGKVAISSNIDDIQEIGNSKKKFIRIIVEFLDKISNFANFRRTKIDPVADFILSEAASGPI